MKAYTTICLFFILGVIACRKESNVSHNRYLQQVQVSLKDSVHQDVYARLDFKRAVLSKVDSVSLCLLPIPFKGAKREKAFLLLQTTNEGIIHRGRQVSMSRALSEKATEFNGHISIRSLSGSLVLDAAIIKGRINRRAGNHQIMSAQSLQPDIYEMMPEVVVVATRNNDNTYSYREWLNLQSLMWAGAGSSGSGGYYSPWGEGDYGGGSYGGGGGSGYYGEGGGEPVKLDEVILIDFETDGEKPAIDVVKYLECFNQVADAGASYSIEIFADVPVDSDPNKIFDFNSGSPGHTFIQLRKANGSQSVMQNIGFYPKLGWKSIVTNAPIEGKFVDNGSHEYNASFKMTLNAEHFKSALTEVLYLANFIKYDLDNYNCTDFALDVFNKVRSQKLDIPLIHIPGNFPAIGTRTPQGLYHQMRAMKNPGHPESSNITIGIFKGWVAGSTGPCN